MMFIVFYNLYLVFKQIINKNMLNTRRTKFKSFKL